ncbi:hypothetical protein EIN_296600 [Entamoeba invadens IP1]|uniref:EF-hand domain-containing protein n=1 Tax=Entamoeba invadens IP1 TaxID=370355 RepID=L7FKX5_ENTIV|nr:hypothetical protein EIN_296600 [Entamoeba invadens IP1]ELP86350.1 hypothetical protein EIN_296600 [Entamoeba invadens IP1]|eukprot:XP_004185696.1 hypothetical protein EIN_296600 [Entamoeba invadens IP1]
MAEEAKPNYSQDFRHLAKGKTEVSLKEMVRYLQARNYVGPLKFYVTLSDTNHNNKVDEKEFIRLMELVDSQSDTNTLPVLLFKLIDSDNSGVIEHSEVENVMENARKFGATNIYECLREVGQKISQDEFVKLVQPIFAVAQDFTTVDEVIASASKLFENKAQNREQLTFEETNSLIQMLGIKTDMSLYSSFADINDDNKINKLEFVRLAVLLKEYTLALKQRSTPGAGLDDPETFCITARLYFKLMDLDDGGNIAKEEMYSGMAKFKKLHKSDIKKKMSKYDQDKSGTIDFPEFKRLFAELLGIDQRVTAFQLKETEFSKVLYSEMMKKYIEKQKEEALFSGCGKKKDCLIV